MKKHDIININQFIAYEKKKEKYINHFVSLIYID